MDADKQRILEGLDQQVEDATAAQREARAGLDAATKRLGDAHEERGMFRLAEMGITLNETVVLSKRYQYDREPVVRCLVTGIFRSDGTPCLRELTKTGAIHQGRNGFRAELNSIEIAGKTNDQ